MADPVVTWEPEVAAAVEALHTGESDRFVGRPLMVAIVGVPGAGKTTGASILQVCLLRKAPMQLTFSFASRLNLPSLQRLLPGSVVIPVDGFHKYLAELEATPDGPGADYPREPTGRRNAAVYRRGHPDTFDPAKLLAQLQKVRDGREAEVHFPGFDHSVGDPSEGEVCFVRAEHRIAIFEGLYLLHTDHGWGDILPFWDYSVSWGWQATTSLGQKDLHLCWSAHHFTAPAA